MDYIICPLYKVYNFFKSWADDINTMFVCNWRKGRKRKRGRERERKKKEEKKFYQCVWILEKQKRRKCENSIFDLFGL